MNPTKLLPGALALATLAGGAQAQIALNEIYVSHTGVDDREYIELLGIAGTDLNGWMVLIVEGDSSSAGTLDRAIDLRNFGAMPNDTGFLGYLVIGDTGVANLDIDLGFSNTLENGSQTIFVINTNNPTAIQALVGTDVDTDDDNNIDVAALSGATVTIIDSVAILDSVSDVVYDGATSVGPDGTLLPAGIFREGDAPAAWCADKFLDFDDVANADQPRNPGESNIADCDGKGGPTEPGTVSCLGVGCPCGNNDASGGCANSTGSGSMIVGTGTASIAADDLVLTCTGIPEFAQGLFFMGDGPQDMQFFDGRLCVGGETFRYLNSIQAAPASEMVSYTGFVADSNVLNLIDAGESWTFQFWHRDIVPAAPCQTGANLSPAYTVTFTP